MAEAKIPSEKELGEHLVNAAIAQSGTLTDASDGSVLSVLLKGAVAPELSALYLAGLTIADGFYVASASGSALRRRLADFGIFPDAATTAFASVRFHRTSGTSGDINIPLGSVVRVTRYNGENLDFSTRASATLLDGDEYVDVVVDATTPGGGHNVGATAVTIVQPISDVSSAEFLTAVTTGRGVSTDSEMREKFAGWLDAKPRGTLSAIKYAALEYSYLDVNGERLYPVFSAGIQEHIAAAGPNDAAVSVYIFGQNGTESTDQEVAAVQQKIDGYTTDDGVEIEGWRPAGVKVYVGKASAVSVDVSVSVTLSKHGTSQDVDLLKTRISSLVSSVPIGSSLKVKSIFDEISAMGPSVENATVLSPVEDVPSTSSQKLVLGTLTVLGG